MQVALDPVSQHELVQASVLDAVPLRVETASGTFAAERAASCLLEPAKDDAVLVWLTGDACWVLAVLSRDHEAPAVLSVPKADSTTIAGDYLTVSCRDLQVAASDAGLVSRSITTMAKTVSHRADNLIQRLKGSLRIIEGTDNVRAGDVDYRASGTARIHGKRSLMTGTELVKLDGDQIHVG